MLGSIVRTGLAVLPWVVIAALLAAERGARRRESAKGRDLSLLLVAAIALVVLVPALLTVGRFAAEVPSRELSRLGEDAILDMDINRVTATVTSHWQGHPRTTVHPIACLLYQPLGYGLRSLGLGPLRSAQLLCTAAMSASALLLALALWRHTRRKVAVLLGAGLYAISFAFLVHSWLPESAALAAPTIVLPYLLLSLFHGRRLTRREHVLHVVAGVLTLGVTTTNLAHSLIVYAVRRRGDGETTRKALWGTARFALQVAGVAAVLAIGQRALYPGSGIWFLPQSAASEAAYVSFGRLQSPGSILDFAAQMLAYPVGGPRMESVLPKGFLLMPQISCEGVLAGQGAMLVWVVWAWLSVCLCLILVRTRRTAAGACALLGVAFNLAMHLVYGRNLLMYAGNWLPPMCFGFGAMAGTLRAKHVPLLLLGLPLIFLGNVRAIGWLSSEVRATAELMKLHYVTGRPLAPEESRVVVGLDGSVSPGVGSLGIRFALWDQASGESTLADSVTRGARRSLIRGYLPMPEIESRAGRVVLSEAVFPSERGGALVRLRIGSPKAASRRRVLVYALITNSGPAGVGDFRRYVWRRPTNTLTADGAPAVVCARTPPEVSTGRLSRALTSMLRGRTTIEQPSALALRLKGLLHQDGREAADAALLCWDLSAGGTRSQELWFRCPAFNAAGNATIGPARPPDTPDRQRARREAAESVGDWERRLASFDTDTPGGRWDSPMKAIAAALALNMEDGGKPVVSPVNYGVFTRDAVYAVYVLLMSGQTDTARRGIDYLLAHPWSGREMQEGDAPGELLWLMGRYWAFSRDMSWLASKRGAVLSLAESVESARSNGRGAVRVALMGQTGLLQPGPAAGLVSHMPIPPRINYGTMDGNGVVYVNSFSIAGLRGGVNMLSALGDKNGAGRLRARLADYEREWTRFLGLIGSAYDWDGRGQCAVRWPCMLTDRGVMRFLAGRRRDWSKPASEWIYLDIDEAHNAMLAGDRSAGFRTVGRYLATYLVSTWRVLDEGGPSSVGYWQRLATNPPWTADVAVPHSWSLASLFALMRDSLVYEEGGACHLLAGVPPTWFAPGRTVAFDLPTEYGRLRFRMRCTRSKAEITLSPGLNPPNGFVLHAATRRGEVRLGIPSGAARYSAVVR